MRRVIISFLLFALVLASACTPAGSDPAPDAAQADDTIGNVLDWDRSPGAVVVRLDTTGGTGQAYNDLNTIPFCTLFGDGHLVWVDPYADPEQVLEDRIDEARIRAFLEYVIGSGFYTWDPNAELLLPVTQEPGEPGPVMERITVTLYGQTVSQTARSNWPREAFASILERCQRLTETPAFYEPTGGWLSFVPVEMRSDIPSLPWEAFAEAFDDLNPATVTLDNPQWVTGDLARALWDLVREGRMQVTREGTAYRLVLQVPVIQPAAPAAPEGAAAS
jgi:hypothetical protein